MKRRSVLEVFLLCGLVLSGCSSVEIELGETTSSPSPPVGDCPVTIPEALVVPPTHPAQPPIPGTVWFGSHELWTVLNADGSYLPAKSVWWSVRFPGGAIEERPALSVSWGRVDGEQLSIESEGRATNANSGDSGDFMIATIDPPDPGCWQVTATYKGARLSYVVKVP